MIRGTGTTEGTADLMMAGIHSRRGIRTDATNTNTNRRDKGHPKRNTPPKKLASLPSLTAGGRGTRRCEDGAPGSTTTTTILFTSLEETTATTETKETKETSTSLRARRDRDETEAKAMEQTRGFSCAIGTTETETETGTSETETSTIPGDEKKTFPPARGVGSGIWGTSWHPKRATTPQSTRLSSTGYGTDGNLGFVCPILLYS